ncbi:hypothetical protein ISCGN_004688 [Ixodes scapularis]
MIGNDDNFYNFYQPGYVFRHEGEEGSRKKKKKKKTRIEWVKKEKKRKKKKKKERGARPRCFFRGASDRRSRVIFGAVSRSQNVRCRCHRRVSSKRFLPNAPESSLFCFHVTPSAQHLGPKLTPDVLGGT